MAVTLICSHAQDKDAGRTDLLDPELLKHWPADHAECSGYYSEGYSPSEGGIRDFPCDCPCHAPNPCSLCDQNMTEDEHAGHGVCKTCVMYAGRL